MVPRKNRVFRGQSPLLMNYSDEQLKQRYILMLIIKNNSKPFKNRVVLNYEMKSKCNERNETKRNETLRNATKYTKRRNETQRNETKFTIMRNEMK